MTCEEVDRDELIEHYVLGRLDAARQEAFEDHYFNCSYCLERLRIVEETRGELAAQSVAGRPWTWRRAAAGLAAAAAVVLAVRVAQDVGRGGDTTAPSSLPARDTSLPAPAPAPSQPIQEGLGAITLPAYAPPRLRATATDAQRLFQDGMAQYAAGTCGAAIPLLQRSLAMDESLTPARFYLAVCELHEGQVDAAADKLQRIAAAGESPYLENAHFFLAKARIRQNDLAAARAELARVIALRGDRLAEARRLLDALR